jgi:hypothetical protein
VVFLVVQWGDVVGWCVVVGEWWCCYHCFGWV